VFGRPLGALALLGAVVLTVPRSARAQAATADAGVSDNVAAEPAPPPEAKWRGTTFLLQQRVGLDTVGVGQDYQSRNPFYDIGVYLRPRFFLWERGPMSLSVRGQFLGSYEVTNSDSTTDKNEFLIEDSLLGLQTDYTFQKATDHPTLVTVQLPRLGLPTSKASRNVGKILDLGLRVLVDHTVPLRKDSRVLPTGRIAARLGYMYGFVSNTTPTNDDLQQVNQSVDGHLVDNGQVGGAAFAQHMGVIRGIIGADIVRDVVNFAFELGVDPALPYGLASDMVCNTPTGCFDPPPDQPGVSDQRLTVTSYLDAYVTGVLFDGILDVSLGYENITGQIGDDGQRRNPFYSPYAKLYLSLEAHLETLYGAFAGPRRRDVAAR